MPQEPHDPMDERHAVPGKRKAVRKSVWIFAALVVMFLLALAVASTSIGIMDRPGADPGATEKAPGDRM